MLLNGVNHVAIITNDAKRLQAFYADVFEAPVTKDFAAGEDMRLSFIDIGPTHELNVFEIPGNSEPQRQTPMFGRGRIDHIGLLAESIDSFDEIRRRLIERRATDGFVTDFGPVLSLFFTDPDGMECEVCVPNPTALPGANNPPGTPAAGYERVLDLGNS
jgi:catechol 2,3-dioxygenase-like lactoylglutathione lyase family enzyme